MKKERRYTLFGTLSTGKFIGIFERLMVITFVLVNQYSAVGFLIATKSLLSPGATEYCPRFYRVYPLAERSFS